MTTPRHNDAPTPSEAKIPQQCAEQIRRLSHDLSNALEIVLQANYLLGLASENSAANQDSSKWHETLDRGVAQATQINREIREYIHAHS